MGFRLGVWIGSGFGSAESAHVVQAERGQQLAAVGRRGIEHAGHVCEKQQRARAERRGDRARHGVRVDVVGHAVAADGHRSDDGDLCGKQGRFGRPPKRPMYTCLPWTGLPTGRGWPRPAEAEGRPELDPALAGRAGGRDRLGRSAPGVRFPLGAETMPLSRRLSSSPVRTAPGSPTCPRLTSVPSSSTCILRFAVTILSSLPEKVGLGSRFSVRARVRVRVRVWG